MEEEGTKNVNQVSSFENFKKLAFMTTTTIIASFVGYKYSKWKYFDKISEGNPYLSDIIESTNQLSQQSNDAIKKKKTQSELKAEGAQLAVAALKKATYYNIAFFSVFFVASYFIIDNCTNPQLPTFRLKLRAFLGVKTNDQDSTSFKELFE